MKKFLIIILICVIKQISAQVCFGSETNYAAGSYSEKIIKADFNNDSFIDIATCNPVSNNVSIFLGTGTGSFNSALSFTVGTFPADLTANDFNSDGFLDLVCANYTSNNVSILLGNGNGTFNTPSFINFVFGYTPYAIASDDFNGDGNYDVVVSSYNEDSVSVLLGTGSGSFGAITNFSSLSGYASEILIKDFNNDGNVDLALTNPVIDSVSILLGTGTGSFSPAVSYAAGSGPVSVTCADFNGDSKPDLAVANGSSNDVSVLIGTGDGSFVNPVFSAIGSGPYSITTLDFNLDGKIDLASANHASNFVSILLGNGNGSFAAAINYTTSTGASDVLSGDFNNDGKADLGIVNDNNNYIGILLNCSTTPTCIATVTDSLYQVAPLTWNIVPQYSSQVNNAIWYWGDGTSSAGLYPSHTYSVAGEYNICVTVYTSCGDSTSTCRNDSIYKYNNTATMVQINVISNITTGVNTEKTYNTFSIYPNPAKEQITLEFTDASEQTLQIFDLNGKEVLSGNFKSISVVDIGSLSAGVYTINVKNNNSSLTQKLVILP